MGNPGNATWFYNLLCGLKDPRTGKPVPRVYRFRFKSCSAFESWYTSGSHRVADTFFVIENLIWSYSDPDIHPVLMDQLWGFASRVVMPEFSWPHMTKRQHANLEQIYDAIRVHEHGHVIVGLRFKNWEQANHFRYRTPSVATGFADGVKQAKKAMAELRQEEHAYDTATDNGLHQSRGPDSTYQLGDINHPDSKNGPVVRFPGGADTKRTWPRC